MKGYNFTEHVRAALARAREESARLHHEYVGTEHILLGILSDDGNLAINIIASFGVKPEVLADAVDSVVKKGRSETITSPDLPYTSRAKKVLELAMVEAREVNHSYVGTEHLLLGLLREEKGIAAQLLVDAGVTLDDARARMLAMLGTAAQPTPRIARAARAAATTSASGQMAASIIELLAQDASVGAVFAAQGIDVAKLVAALRALGRSSPPSDQPLADPPADSPPAA